MNKDEKESLLWIIEQNKLIIEDCNYELNLERQRYFTFLAITFGLFVTIISSLVHPSIFEKAFYTGCLILVLELNQFMYMIREKSIGNRYVDSYNETQDLFTLLIKKKNKKINN